MSIQSFDPLQQHHLRVAELHRRAQQDRLARAVMGPGLLTRLWRRLGHNRPGRTPERTISPRGGITGHRRASAH